jgi:HSP20 family protein
MATRIIRRTFATPYATSYTTPFASEALSLRDMMNRLVESAYVRPAAWFSEGENGPAIDVVENGDAYVVRASLPGWKPEDVDVTFENGVLALKGEVKEEGEQAETRWHHREIRRNSFVRTIALPSEVQADKAKAEFENGVLTLTLPKSEQVKPKQIKIQTGQGQHMQG